MLSIGRDFSWLEVGERARQWRVDRGWTQEQLAVATGMTQPGIQGLEKGATNPQLQTLQRVATALGRSTRELISGEPAPKATGHSLFSRRIDRILLSKDKQAIRVLMNGLHAAELLLDRSDNLKISRPYAKIERPDRQIRFVGDAEEERDAKRENAALAELPPRVAAAVRRQLRTKFT